MVRQAHHDGLSKGTDFPAPNPFYSKSVVVFKQMSRVKVEKVPEPLRFRDFFDPVERGRSTDGDRLSRQQ